MANTIIGFIFKRRKFLLFALSQGSMQFLTFLTNILIVRKLDVYNFGIYSIVMMVVGFAITFGFSWSSSAIMYYGGKEKELYSNINKTFWSRNIVFTISFLILSLIFFAFKSQINNYIGLDISTIILLWILVRVIQDYLNNYFLAIQKQLMSSLVFITSKILLLVAIFALKGSIKELLYFSIISDLISLLYILKIDKNDFGRFEFDKSYFNEILKFSLWQIFGYSGVYIIQFGDVAIIKHFMSIQDVAIYNAAYKLFIGISGLAFVISHFYASKMSVLFHKNQHHELRLFFYHERLIIIVISTVLHLILLVFSKSIILFVFGIDYVNSVKIFNILVIGSMIRYPSVFYTIYYNTNGKYHILQNANIGRALINIILDIVLILQFGLIGPAIATVIAILLTFIYHVIYCEPKIYKYCYSR